MIPIPKSVTARMSATENCDVKGRGVMVIHDNAIEKRAGGQGLALVAVNAPEELRGALVTGVRLHMLAVDPADSKVYARLEVCTREGGRPLHDAHMWQFERAVEPVWIDIDIDNPARLTADNLLAIKLIGGAESSFAIDAVEVDVIPPMELN